jgi:hypothetical protein
MGHLKINHQESVFDQATNKLARWKSGLLNMGGRRELVKIVLSSLPTYLLTAIHAPKCFYKAMDKIRWRFLWAVQQQLHGGKCKVNWPAMCRPLDRGGLGITDLERFGRALRLRWLWFKWKTSDKPWCDLELPVDEVDEALFTTATKVSIHTGNKANFWTSSWLQGCALATMFPTLFNYTRNKNRSVVDAITNENWIRDIMHDMTSSMFLDYVHLWHLVTNSSFDHTDQGDHEIV